MSIDNTEYPQLAKKAVLHVVNQAMDDFIEHTSEDKNPYSRVMFYPGEVAPEDFYVVWFAKTLGNWKALISTDLVEGHYFEVTHNGANGDTYVDWYTKQSNSLIGRNVLNG